MVFTPLLFRKGAFDQAGSQSPENGDHEHILQDRLNTHLQHPVGLFRRVGVIPDFDGLTERPFADFAELARVNIPRGLILVVYVVIAAVRGDIHHDGRRSRPILLLHIFADFAYQYPEGHADTKQARRKQENVKPLLLPFLSHTIISLRFTVQIPDIGQNRIGFPQGIGRARINHVTVSGQRKIIHPI